MPSVSERGWTGRVLRRGRRFYGVDVGVVLVDVDMPRPVGDIGNGRSFAYPVSYEIAVGAAACDMVAADNTGVVQAFGAAAERLVAKGVRVITTSCGLMAAHQSQLVATSSVPIATSALLQVATILQILPANQNLAVLTIDGPALLAQGQLDGVGLTEPQRARVVVAGMQETEHFYDVILNGIRDLDIDRAEREVVGVARALVEQHPSIGAVLLECTNLAPYSPALRTALDRPVWDCITLVDWVQGGFRRDLDRNGV